VGCKVLGRYAALVLAVVLCAGPAISGDNPSFRLCADPDNLPFSSTNNTTPGFYLALGQAVADALGRPFEPVWVPTYYPKRMIRRTLLADQCDAFAGVPDDPSFMGPRLLFSHPLIRLGYALVTPPGAVPTKLADLGGKRVAVQFATPPQDLLATRADITMVTTLSPEEAMHDLASGRADAAFIWGPSARWVNHTALHDAWQVVPVAGDNMSWDAAFGFALDHAALRDAVDNALDRTAEAIPALAKRYAFPDAPPIRLAAGETAADANANAVATGHKLFNDNCAHCHGPDAVEGERRRNLRLLQHRYGDQMDQTFITTVTHGRVSKGMPNWSGILSDQDFHNILAYLQSVQEP
jgi:polar amino acid transport system substrate-binding protein